MYSKVEKSDVCIMQIQSHIYMVYIHEPLLGFHVVITESTMYWLTFSVDLLLHQLINLIVLLNCLYHITYYVIWYLVILCKYKIYGWIECISMQLPNSLTLVLSLGGLLWYTESELQNSYVDMITVCVQNM